MSTPIFGPASGPKEAALCYARAVRAKRLPEVEQFINELYRLGSLVGIDPFLLVAQSAHETGDPVTGAGWQSLAWEQRLNPAGIGITDGHDYGYAFASGVDAARALIAHHIAYTVGNVIPLIADFVHLDPRWDAVFQSGFAGTVRYWEDYGHGKWASDPNYATKILDKARIIRSYYNEGGTKMPNIYDWWLHEDRWVGGQFYPAVKRYYTNRAGYKPKVIVIHIQQGSNLGSWIHFHNVTASCTVMVAKNGDIWRVVPEEHAPWTNGDVCSPTPKGVEIMNQYGWDPNYYTLSIETEGFTDEWPKPQAQLESVLWQVKDWMKRYGIPKSHIVRHADFNQCDRSRCPGDAYFKWLMDRIDDADAGTPLYAEPQPIIVDGKTWDGTSDVVVNGITFHGEQREITVEKDGLRAHKWASKESPLTRAPLKKGEKFRTLGWVKGEKVSTEDRWWVAVDWSRIWAGGTVEKPGDQVNPAPQPELQPAPNDNDGDTSQSDEAPRTRFGLVHYRVGPDGKGRKIAVVKQAVVRQVPLTGTNVVTKVNPGDILTAVEWTRSADVHGEDVWWRVKIDDGRYGYLWVAATDSRPY